jgi:hypothetical protein
MPRAISAVRGPAGGQRQHPQHMQRARVPRFGCQQAPVKPVGLLIPAGLMMGHGFAEQSRRSGVRAVACHITPFVPFRTAKSKQDSGG